MARRLILSVVCLLALSGKARAQTSAQAPNQAPAAGPVGSARLDSFSAQDLAQRIKGSSLAAQIADLVNDPAVARDHWGIMVTNLDGGLIYGLNQAQLFRPASNAKLFTTSAALALLGPNQRLETRVSGVLDGRTGRVKGDLVLKGAGDANFDSGDLPYIAPANRPKNVAPTPRILHDVEDLVDQLVAAGVKKVDGDIVGDDTLFPWEPFGANWSIDDAVWGYGAPVSALTIADNELRLTMAAGAKAGDPGLITLEQAVPYYRIQGGVTTVANKADETGVQVERLPGSHVLRIFGSMAVGAEADVEEVAIDDPAEYAAMALRAALLARGISVKGNAHARHNETTEAAGFLSQLHHPGGEDSFVNGGVNIGSCLSTPPLRGESVLAKHLSAPLAEDVLLTNKVSQNLHAELLLHRLGHGPSCSKGSTVEGARVVRTFLLDAGVDEHDFVFYDGSGLSGHDLVTPRATAKLLAFAATDPQKFRDRTVQPWFADWKASLPVGGEDGTLGGRFAKPPLKDHLFAKTGTLSEARALSGYLDAASGRTVIFSIMVDNHLPSTSADRDTMDKIVAAIQAAE